MHKVLMAAAAGVMLLVSGCATSKESAAAIGPPQPALWVVRDADSTLYLYGTIHLRKPGARWGGPAAETALNEAQEVWTELEIDASKEAAMQGLVVQYGIDREHPLSTKIDPARAPQLQAAATKLGLPPNGFDAMKPWLASLTLTVVPMVQAGYDPNAGVDRAVDRIARAGGKTMRWFETNEEQIRFLSGVSEPLQLQMLYEALDEINEGPAALAAMEAAWERGDDRALATEMVAEMARDYPELYEALLKKRNAAWTEVLTRELAGAGVDFVAVGAAHLAGPDSVQAMLRARGLAVERVTPAPY
ncbi:MAG: TraB/GumN family protein [Hyphomonadaceae bacterium]|nr:MAG: hypothetical protein FD160_1931 [Caulobacteraceae bacterium]MBT9446721.1 TraB/GumN family protein [Hyphomonadaceae bacterium]TPW06770.1 MAG: hypothetical protein FD124_1570 [Alphaproteobacteria bacterium]